MSNAARLAVHGLRCSYGAREVLRGLDLVVPSGTVTAVLGPSGGGKTTLLRLIAGFEQPHAGSITVDDELLAGDDAFVSPEQRRVGIVPQEGALFPHLDVAGNVGFGLRRGAARDARVREMLELVGLPDAGHRRPAELSGGQQQRIALARALAPAPRLVLLDEPFTALDAALRAVVRDEVFAMLRTAGTTAVLVTHDRTEAFSVADDVAVLLDGRIAQHGTPSSIYEHPVSCEVAMFVGEGTVLRGRRELGGVRHALGITAITAAVGGGGVGEADAFDVVVRPEHAVLTAAGDGAADGTVARLSFHGHDTMTTVALDSGEEVVVRVPGSRSPRRGERVGVRLAAEPLLYPATRT